MFPYVQCVCNVGKFHNIMDSMGNLFTKYLFIFVSFFLNFSLLILISIFLFYLYYVQPSRKYLVYPVLLRLVFVPLFLFCNYRPADVTRVLPVYIQNDYIYWGLGVIMSFSSGYLSSLAMMYAPSSQTNPSYQVKAGMMAAAMLISGLFSGILFSFLPPILVQYELPF